LDINDPADMFAVEVVELAQPRAREPQSGCRCLFRQLCTAVRTLEVFAGLEAALGKPVITSNLVTGWHALHSMGIEDWRNDLGVFFSQH
jgi:maleate isomerase